MHKTIHFFLLPSNPVHSQIARTFMHAHLYKQSHPYVTLDDLQLPSQMNIVANRGNCRKSWVRI